MAVPATGHDTTCTPFDQMWRFLEDADLKPRKEKKRMTWSCFLALTYGRNTLLSRRAATRYPNTTVFPSSAVLPSPRQDYAQLSVYSSWGSTPERQQFCSLWPEQPFQEDTDPTNSPRVIRFHGHIWFHASEIPLWRAGMPNIMWYTSHTTNWGKKYISIIKGAAIHSVDISQYTLPVFGIRNFFLALFYLAVRICPQHPICSPCMPHFLWQLFCSCFVLNSLQLNTFFLHVDLNAVQ